MRYDRIDHLRPEYSVGMLCRLLQVSEAGYYAWRRRLPSPRTQENARLSIEIKLAHDRTRQTYGPERLQAELADHGIHAGVDRIKRRGTDGNDLDRNLHRSMLQLALISVSLCP